MPTTRRRSSRYSSGSAAGIATPDQYMQHFTPRFLAGSDPLTIAAEAFPAARDGKAFYRRHAAELDRVVGAGHRHEIWWACVSPEPRDHTVFPEALQLWRLGVLSDDELPPVADVLIRYRTQLTAAENKRLDRILAGDGRTPEEN